MLHKMGPIDEETLIEALKEYIEYYVGNKKEPVKVPYFDVIERRYFFGEFLWLAEQWVCVGFFPLE